MSTLYTEVYSMFLSNITDYSFVNLTQSELEDILKVYLIKSIPEFKNCIVDLSARDDTLKQFNNTLSDEEIKILATQMIVEYLNPQILSSEYIRISLGNKDWKQYSPANQLKELKDLRATFFDEANSLMNKYGYSISGLSDLK